MPRNALGKLPSKQVVHGCIWLPPENNEYGIGNQKVGKLDQEPYQELLLIHHFPFHQWGLLIKDLWYKGEKGN